MFSNGFDTLSPFYNTALTYSLFGTLQRSTILMCDKIQDGSTILAPGSGTGFYIPWLLHTKDIKKLLCVDSSPGMCTQAEKEKNKLPSNLQKKVEIRCDSIFNISSENYDTILFFFFLDLFQVPTQERILFALLEENPLNPQCIYLDFSPPGQSLFYRSFISMLYIFFRATCNIDAKRLHRVEPRFAHLDYFQTYKETFFHGIYTGATYHKKS